MTNAKIVSTAGSKNNGNQKPFEKMIIMKYDCVGIGLIKMTVGVRRQDSRESSVLYYYLPQECAGDVYRLVGLGARTWH